MGNDSSALVAAGRGPAVRRTAFTAFLAILTLACDRSAPPDAAADGTVAAIAARLSESDGTVPHDRVAAMLDRLRSLGASAAGAGPALSALLRESAPLYRSRGPNEATRLRGYVLATLAGIGPPLDALASLREILLLEQSPYLLAAAARAAGAIGPGAADLVPSFDRVLDPAFADDLVCLDAYNVLPTAKNGTTARIEAIRAIARIGAAPSRTRTRLRALAEAPSGRFGAGDRVQAEARLVSSAGRLEASPSDHSCCDDASAGDAGASDTPLLAAEKRVLPPAPAISLTDQDGKTLAWGDLFDRPAALCFFYTQCDNPRKCSATVSRMGSLQRALADAGLAGRTRLVLVTLDPAFDSDLVRRRYAELRGFEPSSSGVLASTSEPALREIVSALGVNANFGQGRINLHGVELFVLDHLGRVARRHGSAWTDAEVAGDLRALLAEASSTRPSK